MSTLGKVLLFLNLLAAGGLVYLSAQDWAKRQEINGIVVRHYLTLQGLPLDPPKGDVSDDIVNVEIQTSTGTTIETITSKLLDTQFAGAAGGDIYSYSGKAITNVSEELNRVEKVLLSQIEAQQGDEGKIRMLVGGADSANIFQPGILLNMAESFEERSAIRSLGYPKPATPELMKRNAEEARNRILGKLNALKLAPAPAQLKMLTAQIEELKQAIEKNPADAAAKKQLAAISGQGEPPFTRDDTDRRRRTALFLMLLDPGAAWQKRVMLVTGLRSYSAALTEQVARVTDITRQTERALESDQATFETEYELLKKLAIRQDIHVIDQTGILKGLTEAEAQDQAQKAARQTQQTALNTQLAALQQHIAAVLANQATAEKAVFDLQRKVGDSLKNNLELESRLDRAERPPR